MKLTTLAATALILASGHATAQQGAQAPILRDTGGPVMVDTRVGTDTWARQTDFATASGSLRAPALAPLGDVEFGRPPGRAGLPDGADPVVPPPPGGATGAALADNLAVENNALNGFINVSQVPEPSALLMMLAGLGAIAFVIRRRRSNEP
jgi:hypothetical protein